MTLENSGLLGRSLRNRLNVGYWILFVLFEYLLASLFSYNLSVLLGESGVDLPSKFGGNQDGLFYFKEITTSYVSGDLSNPTGTKFVPMMVALSDFWGSVDILFMRLVNIVGCFLLLLSTVLTMKIVGRNEVLDDGESSIWLMIRMATFPSAILAIAFPFTRDVWIHLFFVLSVGAAAYMVKEGFKIVRIPLLVIPAYALYTFRGYAAVSIIVGCLIYYFVRKASKRMMCVYACGMILIFFVWSRFLGHVVIPIINMNLNDALAYQSGYFIHAGEVFQRRGGSDFMPAFDNSNTFLLFGQIILSYVGNLFGPFIWQIGTLTTGPLFFLETIPMLYLVYRLIRKRTEFAEFLSGNQAAVMLLSQAFSWLTMMALSNKNIGTGMRLKVPLFIFIWVVYYAFNKYDKQNNEEGIKAEHIE